MTASDHSSSALFQPLRIGKTTLKNRVVLAPLTRFRAGDDHAPLPMVAEYYAQRGSVPGTLLITEATLISPRAAGYANVPGLWSDEQLKAWKQVTDAVHAKGSFIYAQLWALGRAADPKNLKDEFGLDYVSSSATPLPDSENIPRELSESEIHDFINDYRQAAKNAIEIAGFDGVEIHGANGYLIDQFTQDTCNKRTDKWGGSIENRSRFALEVTKAVVDAVGADRTGIRLSPWSKFQGMRTEDPIPQFSHLVKGLKEFNLAYLHLVESRISGNADVEGSDKLDFAIDIWGKTSPILLAGGFKPASAFETVDKEYKGKDIAIVFGRYFISTPDLPYRLLKGIEFTPYDRNKFYIPKSAEGYTDWEFSKEFQEEFGSQAKN